MSSSQDFPTRTEQVFNHSVIEGLAGHLPALDSSVEDEHGQALQAELAPNDDDCQLVLKKRNAASGKQNRSDLPPSR